MVEYQLQSGQEALLQVDQALADRIIKLGKKVNTYDVKVDRQCENALALFTPVAVDLRTLLAILKINANLERIGDSAEGIGMYVKQMTGPFTEELLTATRALEMYNEALAMLAEGRSAFLMNDTVLAKQVIKRDRTLNKIYHRSETVIETFLKENPDKIKEGLMLHSIIKKLERIGDQITNIAEEVIFYRDAKVVKHKKKKKKRNDEKGEQ